VERKHQHLIDTTLALLAASSLPKKFWDDACLTSCYLINRLPTPLLNLSPFQKLFSQVPDYKFLLIKKNKIKNKFLEIFGCACFPNLRAYNSHKFSLRSKPCVFLGYSTLHKGYECYHPEHIFISRDVIFHEDVFSFSNTTSSPAPVPPSSNLVSFSYPYLFHKHWNYQLHPPTLSPLYLLPLLIPTSLALLFLLFHLLENQMCHILSNLPVYILCGPELKIMSAPSESSLTGQCTTLYLGPCFLKLLLQNLHVSPMLSRLVNGALPCKLNLML
jgi:hypothetical protein